ncbi:MAG: hypothetical protein ACREMN_08265 [Gemmatimonadales bacterium]
MTPPRASLLGATYLFALVAGLACSDAPAAPVTAAQADTTRYADLSTRDLLLAVLTRLDALEARVGDEARAARKRLDSALAQAAGGPQLAAAPASASLATEASVCFSYEFAADAQMESKVRMTGAGVAGAGVDAYGNGAVAAVGLQALQELKVVPGGNAALQLQVCGKMGTERSGQDPNATSGVTRVAAAAPAPSQAQQLLSAALDALPPDQLAAAARMFRMEGSRMRQGLDLVTAFSLADLPFGRGASGSLIDVLPLPMDVANLIRNPEDLLDKAGEAGQYAIDRLCDQRLFTGQFAQRASEACDLRDEAPSVPELIDIVDQLDGLPNRISAVDDRLSSACTTVRDELVPQTVVIPQTNITKTGVVVGVFPRTTIRPFAGLGAIC